MKELLKSVILEFQQRELPVLTKRKLSINFDLPIIVTLVGARRSGKTCLLYQTMSQLVDKGVKREDIIFLNFEDERLTLDVHQLDLILQAYTELYTDKKLSDCWFFFDEIQNVDGWEKFIRRIFDNYSKHVFITGSNAKLLSTEIADSLRGRTLTYEVYPLSFAEYLRFRGVEYNLIHPLKKAKVINQALQFIKQGGFPELINFDNEERIKILQSYFNTMIFRDIVERYKISDVQLLKFFIKKLFANIGKPLSINKIYNEIRSMGYKVSNNYLYEFEQYCYNVFLSISVPKFDFSEIKQAKSDKKLYAIDTGLLSSVEFSLSENRGKLLENAVLLELIKSGVEVFYYKGKFECDFVIKNRNSLQALQVSWEVESMKTQNREFRALLEVCHILHLTGAQIITFDQKQILNIDNTEIQLIPFYEWASNLHKNE
jgi:predicted AAA+ superfamily ATPase